MHYLPGGYFIKSSLEKIWNIQVPHTGGSVIVPLEPIIGILTWHKNNAIMYNHQRIPQYPQRVGEGSMGEGSGEGFPACFSYTPVSGVWNPYLGSWAGGLGWALGSVFTMGKSGRQKQSPSLTVTWAFPDPHQLLGHPSPRTTGNLHWAAQIRTADNAAQFHNQEVTTVTCSRRNIRRLVTKAFSRQVFHAFIQVTPKPTRKPVAGR